MISSIAFFLAQTAPTTSPASNGLGFLGRPEIMMVVMVVIFYFLLIRPQQRQRKELAARIASLQTGDRVITTSGIHGIIHNVRDNTVVIKVAEGTMLEFDKAAVGSIQKKDSVAK